MNKAKSKFLMSCFLSVYSTITVSSGDFSRYKPRLQNIIQDSITKIIFGLYRVMNKAKSEFLSNDKMQR